MITTIKEIKKKFDENKNSTYYVIYFDYGDFKNAFTYFTKKSLLYWRDRGVTKLRKGMKINVFKVPNSKYFKVVEMGDKLENGKTNE
jgi:hypothetical protein